MLEEEEEEVETYEIFRMIFYGNPQALNLRNTDQNSMRYEGGRTPIICATERNLVGFVQKLLMNGDCKTNLQDIRGETALHYAIRNRSTTIIDMLLRWGADPRISDHLGNSPMTLAAGSGQVEAVEMMLNYVGVNERDNSGRTALHGAAEMGQSCMVSMLLRAGADQGMVDDQGRTPMVLAEEKKKEECISVFRKWKEEQNRLYVLERARSMSSALPHCLAGRVVCGLAMPRVHVMRGEEDESGAIISYVVKDMNGDLFTELNRMMPAAPL